MISPSILTLVLLRSQRGCVFTSRTPVKYLLMLFRKSGLARMLLPQLSQVMLCISSLRCVLEGTKTCDGWSFVATAFLWSGKIPLARNPLLHWSGVRDYSHNWLRRLRNTSFNTFCALDSIFHCFTMCPHIFLTGENTPTSSGWSMWVQLSRRQNSCTFFSFAFLINSRLMWEWCPSMKRNTGPDEVRCALYPVLINIFAELIWSYPLTYKDRNQRRADID